MTTATPERVRTGIAGLDDILGDGLPANRVYLIQGDPGVGKTTLALQFLLEGVRCGESVLYVTLSETREEIGDDVTIIALTGYGQPEDRRRALEAGFDCHLIKPVEPARLQRLISAGRDQLPRTG